MKNLKEAKVGDLMYDIKDDIELRIVDTAINTIVCENLDGFGGRNYTVNGCRLNSSPLVRVLFYKGQITENEYLGMSADGVKMFGGMDIWKFNVNDNSTTLFKFLNHNEFQMEECSSYSAAYSTREAAEKAQKEHFEPETWPLPWWLTVLELDKCPSVRIGSLPFRFSVYSNGWGKVPTDIADVVPAHFVKVQFSELSDGDFFTNDINYNSILLKISDEKCVKITNEGEVRNQNLGKLSEVFKVVAPEVEKEVDTDGLVTLDTLKSGETFKYGDYEYIFDYADGSACTAFSDDGIEVVFASKIKVTKINQPEPQKVELGTLSVGEKFSFEADGTEHEIYGSASGHIWYEDNEGRMFENNDPSEMVYKIQNDER